MAPFESPALPLGSTILVTGANGYLGAHVADQLLGYGYRVRGTVRDAQKHAWLREVFDEKHGKGEFELVEVKDMSEEGAFDDAVKGVAGVAHVATVIQPDTDPEKFIDATIAGTISVLKSAAKEPRVKRFVLTSTSAAVRLVHGYYRDSPVTADEFNTEALETVKAIPDSLPDMEKYLVIYSAAKTKGEQAMWNWAKENKPSFTVNSVLPPFVIGRPLSVKHQGYPSSAGLAPKVFKGEQTGVFAGIERFYYVNVEDIGRLHVAGLIHPRVEGERIFGYAGTFTLNDWLAAFRRWHPDRKFPDDIAGLEGTLSTIEPRGRAEALLRDLGRPGFAGMEESLRANVADLV